MSLAVIHGPRRSARGQNLGFDRLQQETVSPLDRLSTADWIGFPQPRWSGRASPGDRGPATRSMQMSASHDGELHALNVDNRPGRLGPISRQLARFGRRSLRLCRPAPKSHLRVQQVLLLDRARHNVSLRCSICRCEGFDEHGRHRPLEACPRKARQMKPRARTLEPGLAIQEFQLALPRGIEPLFQP